MMMSTSTSWEESLPALRSRLVGRARRLGVDRASAEDLAQDTLQEAWRLRDRVYDPAGIDRWVDAIFTNVHRRWVKRTGHEHTARSQTPSSEVDVADDYDLEMELERGELADLLDRALGLLPAETRDVLIGRFVQETPLGELAGQLGLQPSTLGMRLQRGKLALRSLLTTRYADEAVSLGLVGATETGWQETRIWCPECGMARLRGRFSGPQRGVEFVCPGSHQGWQVNAFDTAVFGVSGFRATFNKVGAWAYQFWLDRLDDHDDHDDDPYCRAVTWDQDGCVQTHDSVSGWTRTHPGLQTLYTPDGRQFWHDHPRIRTVAYRRVEADGAPALLTSYQSVTDRARLDVVLGRHTFRILRSHQS